MTDVLLGQGGVTSAGWHSIESFYRCEKEYQFQHVRKIKLPTAETPDYFAVGIFFHAARAKWFSLRCVRTTETRTAVMEAIDEARETLDIPATDDAVRRAQELIGMYMDHWSTRLLPRPEAAEYLLGPSALHLDDVPYSKLHVTARLDDVSYYPDAQGLWIGEGKTTSGSIADCVKQYELHGQILLQAALWRVAPQGEARFGPIAGVMLDIVKKPYGKEKAQFARHALHINPKQLDWFVENLRGMRTNATNMTWDMKPVRNVTQCTRLVGRMRAVCPYRELCRHGKTASIHYTMEDGSSLLDWKPSPGQATPPWE